MARATLRRVRVSWAVTTSAAVPNSARSPPLQKAGPSPARTTASTVGYASATVAEVAVCAGPDEVWGERVVAFVRARGEHAPTLAELREHVLGAGLAPHKAPEHLEVVEDLPRTATGKVLKTVLRDRLRAASV